MGYNRISDSISDRKPGDEKHGDFRSSANDLSPFKNAARELNKKKEREKL